MKRNNTSFRRTSSPSISYNNLLLRLLAKYRGLLAIEPKVLVKDNYKLALVYTPGVGKCCTEIKNDPNKINTLTNRANSLLVITDGSGIPGSSGHNFHLLPYIETLCLFYKLTLNIDAYPILLDSTLTADPEALYQTLYNLSPAYAGFELYGFSQKRLQQLEVKLHENGNFKSFIFHTQHRDFIKTKLASTLKITDMQGDLAIGCLIRALLDYGVTEPMVNICAQTYFERLRQISSGLKTTNMFDFARACIEKAANCVFEDQPDNSISFPHLTEANILNKLEVFYREGQEGWVEYSSNKNYLDKLNPLNSNAVELHRAHKGTVRTASKVKIQDLWIFSNLLGKEELGEVSALLKKEQQLVYELTCKSNYCAIITNGTAVLGFGDIGPEAGLPVMEGKSALFKELGGVNVVPICIKEKDPKKVVEIIKSFGNTFSGINLEDIKAPECFDIENELIEALDIPVFHDDQHGTAIVVVAAFLNALKVVEKKAEEVKVVVNGAGAAGTALTELLTHFGVADLIICDRKGAIYEGRKENMNKYKEKLAEMSNKKKEQGGLKEVLKDADVFIGVSSGGVLKPDMIKAMKEKPIIFALANPTPEIMPDEAKEAGAYVIATGRSDFPNQVNNSLVFPGLFKGLMSIRARKVTLEMKKAAARAIADLATKEELSRYHIISTALDRKVPETVAKFVVEAGLKEGVGRVAKKSEILEAFTEKPKL